MSKSMAILSVKAADIVAAHLQGTLVDLLDLSLQLKQAHWNVVGPQFKPVHEHLDENVDIVRAQSDEIAERIRALNYAPDGQAHDIATSTKLHPLPSGAIPADKVIAMIAERILDVVKRLRESIEALDDADPVSQDMVIEVAQILEKQHWLLTAQLPTTSNRN